MQTIDAQNKILGRVASEAAKIMLGKKSTSFAKNSIEGEEVKIINASKIRVSGNKAKAEEYRRYTGHPGGLRSETYNEIVARKGVEEVIRLAVYGMLPGNRLRSKRMKLLTIEK
jgi:large subunit ribosomal protein L13